MPKVLLVCGGREYADRAYLYAKLDLAYHMLGPFDLLIHGAAKGADTLARSWAMTRGVKFKDYPADWNAHGKSAGPIRNQKMLDEGKPDVVIAFPGGTGTADMVTRAKRAKVKVVQIP